MPAGHHDRVFELNFGTTGYCHAKCKFCIYPSKENAALPKGHMNLGLYKKIIDEAATIPQIDVLVFSGLSETLLDPLFTARVAYAHAAKPTWRQELYTTGVLLTPEVFEKLKKAGLTAVMISLNAVRPEQHESIMGLKGQFELVCDNIKYAIEHKDQMHVDVRAVYSKDDFTMEDVMAFYKRWGHASLGGYGKVNQEMNWADQLGRTISTFDPNESCIRALGRITVYWDGRVPLCCLDLLVKHPFGDLKTQTIREIYNSEAYTKFRELHRDNKAAQHPACAVCTRA
jgi:molybdenum cofactor biosynthesis enzyme MoaA